MCAVVLTLAASPAYAHAFGQRYDLPLPLGWFLAAAAAAVALSFAVIGAFMRPRGDAFRYPRADLLAVPLVGRAVASPPFLFAVRAASVFMLLLTLATAFFGSTNPLENLSPTFVWIIWWVGMGYIAALFGNLWMLINPWKALFEWGEWLTRRALRKPAPGAYGCGGLFAQPAGWDMLPALVGFGVFIWLENVYPNSVAPRWLGTLIVVYSLTAFGGMLAFGKHAWLRYGDPFSALFGLFARFSPTEAAVDRAVCADCPLCRADAEADAADAKNDAAKRAVNRAAANPEATDDDDAPDCVDCYACFEAAPRGMRRLNLRPWAVGLVSPGRVSWQMAAFAVLALAAVTFDGVQETPAWLRVQELGLRLLGAGGVSAVDTLGVALVPLLFGAVYLPFCAAVRALSGDGAPLSDAARAYALSLIPIALAYNMAHFLSLLLVQGQLIIPLASDPFGFGWDLFGGAGYRIDPGVITTRAAWAFSVAAIVVGHILSVYIAHHIALRRAASHALALRGQYPMLALMVIYTAVSLWIIAQPIVAR